MAYTTIDKSSLHFNTVQWTGNASTNAITGVGFRPDWIWGKSHTSGYSHQLYDVLRGATYALKTNGDAAQETLSTGLTSFDSDGFTLGSNTNINASGHTVTAWNWKAGTTGSGTTGGSGTAKSYSYSVNTTSGFSIVKYEGNGTNNHQIPHHLGAVPKMIIFKNEQNGYGWDVYHDVSMGNAKRMYLSASNAEASATNFLNSTTPTSTYINLGDAGHTNHSGTSHIAYVFAEKTGYSKFGSYTGNGNADGTFVYLGFKPHFFLIKRVDSAEDWIMTDSKRGYPQTWNYVLASTNAAEASGLPYDFLSNGVKFRGATQNVSGATFLYMAFGQSLVGSNNVPCTAR